ncbi:MAG: hypothetical protein R6U95_10380 [Bacteroidales bacterium]
MDIKNEKRIKNIDSLIEEWCKKKSVSVRALLLFEAVDDEVHVYYYRYLQITQINFQAEIYKRIQFWLTLRLTSKQLVLWRRKL